MLNLNNLGPILQLVGHMQKILGAIDDVFAATTQLEDALNTDDAALEEPAQVVIDRVGALYALMKGGQSD